MSKNEKLNNIESLRRPNLRFTEGSTLLFVTGSPLSGKSTIAPLVTSSITECTLQNMDIIRLVAQQMEKLKPKEERSPFINYGSCDSYRAIGDGTYSPERLIEGFNSYSELVTSVLDYAIPRLEVQGARNILFEGVQLTPSLISKYLKGNSKLVVVTSDAERLRKNRKETFGSDDRLLERYSVERLLLLQEEILDQAGKVSDDQLFIANNTGDYIDCVGDILKYLQHSGVVQEVN